MKIECIKDKLGEVLSRVDKIPSKNPSLPVLTGLHLSASKNTLTIKATNLDLGISTSLSVKVIEPGRVVVPAQTFSSFISSLTGDKNITISTKGQTLEVKTKNTKTVIKTLPSEDFPLIPEIDDSREFSLPSRDLVLGFKSVIYASAVGSMKPELSSISVTSGKEGLVFAATDSFRLAEKRIRTKKVPQFKQILIPQKNVLEIIRALDRSTEEVSISVEEHQAAFRLQDLYLTSRVIDGSFPNYQEIIPKKPSTNVTLLKQDLIASLKTSSIFSDSFNQLSIKVSPKEKTFEIESKNTNLGENTSSVEAVLKGEEVVIGVNGRFFADCFQSIASDSVSLEFSGQAKPIVIKGVGDTNFLYLVMPMNRS